MEKVCSKCGEVREIIKNYVCDDCLKKTAKIYRDKYRLNEAKEKTCTKCGKIEHIKKGSVCKECVDKRNEIYFSKPEWKEKKKNYYEYNKEEIFEKSKDYWKNNPDKKKLINQKYYENNRLELIEKNNEYQKLRALIVKEKKKNYLIENKEVILKKKKEKIKEYLEKNFEKRKEIRKQFKENNLEYCLKRDREYRKISYRTLRTNSPHMIAWRSVLRNSLKRFGSLKEGKTIDLLGYSATQLKEHIEKRFIDDMTWDNYGKWEIDHIKEVCTFDKESPMSVVNSLDNLQPLWRKDNLNKWLELKKKLKEHGL